MRLPRTLQSLELEVTALIKDALHRGKVDVSITLSEETTVDDLPTINPKAVEHYLALLKQLDAMLPQSRGLPSAYELLRLEGVISAPTTKGDADEKKKEHAKAITDLLKETLTRLKTERAREGEALRVALAQLNAELESNRKALVKIADKLIKAIFANYLKRMEGLQQRLQEVGLPVAANLSEDRLYLEISILTDKCDIEEELTRLGAHINEFEQTLKSNEPAGRKLDFLCQEMHREVNTMSNKLVQTEVTHITLAMKQGIERLRQQVQNIE